MLFCLISACVSLLYHRTFQITIDFMAGFVPFLLFSFSLCSVDSSNNLVILFCQQVMMLKAEG